MCLFEAPNAETVRELNETAKIPFTRIVEAQDLTPGPGGAGDRKIPRKRLLGLLACEPGRKYFSSSSRPPQRW